MLKPLALITVLMGMEGWNKPRVEKTPEEQKVEKDDRRAKGALAGLIAALGVTMAAQEPLPTISKDKVLEPDHFEEMENVKQPKLPDLEPSMVTMKPPGDAEPVTIKLKEMEPVTIDLAEKIVTMTPPEDPFNQAVKK